MRQNNLYTVNPLYDGTTSTGTGTEETGKSGGTTIIYLGGGLSSADREKLNSIQYGAQVNQDAFGIIRLGDGSVTSVLDAGTPRDTADLKITGGGTIKVNLTYYSSIANTESIYVSKTGSSTYLFNYGKVETPDPVLPAEGEDPKPPIVTWPLTIKYVSGETTPGSSLSKIVLLKKGKIENVFSSENYTLTLVDGKILQATILKEGLDFDSIQFREVTGSGETSIDKLLCEFKVPVQKYNTINISDNLEASELWKLDEDGNIYTERNVYSTKEISAYGKGPGGGGTGGAGALYECADVLRDGDKVLGATNGSLLSYNGTHWYGIPLSAITPDLTGYATLTWTNSAINIAVNKLIDSAPGTLDTLKEIAEALGNDPNFAATITGLLNAITIRVTELENKIAIFNDMFEWDKSVSATDSTKWIIKAKRDLFSIGEISAYGYSSGTAPTGAQYLHELKDVALSNITSGLLLKYNGTKWVNINANEVGLNETQLATYLTANNYAKKSDIPSLVGYATESWVTGLKFAKQSITITTENGLTGGGDLTSNRIFSLATVGTAGKYTKVTTDPYGRVVLGENVLVTDIVGLLYELDKKLNIADFNKWFVIEQNTDGTIKSIKALYDFCSVGEISAYGIGPGDIPIGVQHLNELKDVKITSPADKQTLVYDATLSKWVNGSGLSKVTVKLGTVGYDSVSGIISLPAYPTTLPASDVYAWAKAATKPSYAYNEVGTDTYTINTGNYIAVRSPGRTNSMYYEFWDNGAGWADIQARSFKIADGNANQLLRADGGVATLNWSGQSGQPTWLWGGNAQHNYTVYNPANFRVANAETLTGFTSSWSNSPRDANTCTSNGLYYVTSNYPSGMTVNDGALYVQAYSDTWVAQIAQDYRNGDLQVRGKNNGTWQPWYKVLTTRNWNSITDGRYLPLTGGTVTGIIKVFEIDSLDGNGLVMYQGGNSILAAAANTTYIRSGNTNLLHRKEGVGDGKIWDEFNDGAGSGLDADMLDGVQFADMNIPAGILTSVSGTVLNRKNDLVDYFNTHSQLGIGQNAYVSESVIRQWNNDSATLYASSVYSFIKIGGGYTGTQFAQWLGSSYGEDRPFIVGRTNNVWGNLHYIAYVTDNVASATQLQTARSIWGQSFNGTGNITGRAFIDSRLGYAPTISLAIGDSDTGFNWASDGYFKVMANSQEVSAYTTDGTHFYLNGTYNGGWYRSYGNNGWYNEDYGGGIHMTDSTWVRVYAGKRFLVGNVLRTSAGTATGCNGFQVSNQAYSSIEIYNSDNTLGIGVDPNDNAYIWGTAAGSIDSGSNKRYLCYIELGSGNFNWLSNIVATGEVTAYSDVRLKSNIQDLTVRGRLQPKTFIKDNKESIGFIALDILALYPELVLVGTDDNHYLSVNYGAITAVLSALLNTVEDEISVLKNRIKELETRSKDLEDRLYQCENNK